MRWYYVIQKKYMLATDLDGTFVGNETGLQELLHHYEEAPYEVSLVYVTGRHFDSAKTLIHEEKLPKPDLLITDVGTAIYHENRQDITWHNKLMKTWHPEDVLSIAEEFPELHRQPLPDNKRVSFTVQNDDRAVMQFRRALEQKAPDHTFIYSSHRDVDVLPAQAGKGSALEYAIEHYAEPDVHLLIAGDSGNDMDMLSLGHPSVIVGNAQRELISMNDHPNLYRAKNHCAGGIHEAWMHFYG